MPVLTRSQTRFIAERETAYAEMRHLNAKHVNAVGAWDKCHTLANSLVFIKENRHVNDLLKTGKLFRRAVYVNCNKLLNDPLCTKTMMNTCKALRLQIEDIGVWT